MATSLHKTKRMDFRGLALQATDLDLTGDLSITGDIEITGALASDDFTLTATSASTSGSVSVEPFNVDTTLTGIGGVGGRGKFTLTTNVALGSWSNALKGEVTYGASGKTAGLGSAIVAEMTLSAGTADGTYAPLELELNLGANAVTGTATSLIYASVNGADASTFDTNGYLFNIAGVTVGTNKVFANNGTIDANELTLGLRVKIAGADYYIPLATAANFAD